MFSVNQVKHLFVLNAAADGSALTNVGDWKVVKSPLDGKVRIQHMGMGGLVTSDAIDPSKVIYVASKKNTELAMPLKKAVIQLDANVNSGNPIAGEDYIVDIVVSNYICMADESTLVKFGAVRATAAMEANASDFYLALAKSFVRNFSRDINKFFKFYVTTETSSVGTDSTKWSEVTLTSNNTPGVGNSFTAIIVVEQSQEADYVKGEFPVRTVNFQIYPHTVMLSGDEVKSIKDVEVVPSGSVVSGSYGLSDLEFFALGERADQYRQMGYPRTIRTKYMVDTATEYDVIEIAYYFQGRGVDAQHSDKEIVILAPVVGSDAHAHDSAKAIIEALNEALATEIPVEVEVTEGEDPAEGTGTLGPQIETIS